MPRKAVLCRNPSAKPARPIRNPLASSRGRQLGALRSHHSSYPVGRELAGSRKPSKSSSTSDLKTTTSKDPERVRFCSTYQKHSSKASCHPGPTSDHETIITFADHAKRACPRHNQRVDGIDALM